MNQPQNSFSREVFRRILRNLGFFLKSPVGGKAKWLLAGLFILIQLIPVLLVAPLFIQHKIEFGVIGQATMAFATLLGAFSLVITQFQAISAYASVLLRLGEFVESAEKYEAEHR